MAKDDKKTAVVKFPCAFGNVNIGDHTARIGVRVARGFLNINAADECLPGHRLDVVAKLNKEGEDPKQQTLLDDIKWSVKGSADVKQFAVTADNISFGLTFSIADIKVEELSKFAKGTGEIQIMGVGEIPEDSADEHE